MIQFSDIPPLFSPGSLVRHRRYSYRGVIVACDPQCMAPESWYASNQTQPPRHQPWYHVLVHSTDTTTYTAQDSLMIDTEGLPISHPLLETYFDAWESGRYLRNDRSWPNWPQ